MKLQTFNRSVSLRTLQNFYEHLFWRISTKGCFCKLTKKTNSNQTTNLCYLFLKPRKNICKSHNFLNFIVLTEKCYVVLNFILTWFSIVIRTFHKPIIIGIKSSKNVCRYAIHLNSLSTSTNSFLIRHKRNSIDFSAISAPNGSIKIFLLSPLDNNFIRSHE